MARPSKLELLSKFFPEIKQKSSKADKEAAVAYNTLACEVVLADQLRLFDQGYSRLGPGVLCVRLRDGADASSYLTVEDLQVDRAMAVACADAETETFLADVLRQIGSMDFEKAGLIMLVDNSSIQLFPIDREFPARSVQALLEEFSQ
jgi:hypothetical protein